MSDPTITILFDNYPGAPGLRSLWGFSALLRHAGRTVLFDTGSNGRVLLRNMAALGLDPGAVDLVFLSHPHWDHMGGLDSILEVNPGVTVALHEGFSRHLIRDLEGLCGGLVVVGTGPRPLGPGLHATGILDGQPPEQALVVDGGDVAATLSGCSHPGIERIVARGREILGRPVDWAVGGFHLMEADAAGIERTIGALRRLGVHGVLPTHCTGEAARAAFARAYGERCLDGGVGRTVRLRPPGG